jgi:TolB-like protein
VTEPSKALFLSYASQDVGPARLICEALRAAGIEVWFDQSELRGGDVWDQKIRQQIKDCALFVPVISANTAARHEGYFRLEWDLADQRTHMIARNRAFIVPVCIDGTPDSGTDVPESFARVQWSRLPGGETPPAFVERIARLLSPETGRAAAHTAAVSRRRMPAISLLIAALAVIALGNFALDRFFLWKRPAVGAEISGQPIIQDAPRTSIAVMPFANLTGDVTKDYLGDGMAEEVINTLTKIPGLQVPARTSSFAYKARNTDIRQIARDLHVGAVLEGSVRSAGDRIRVTAQLIDAQTGLHLWSQTYDRKFTDLFRLQDDLAMAIVEALQINMSGASPGSVIQTAPSRDVEAYNLYLQGFSAMLRGTEQSLHLALDLYQQALARDPAFARAYAARSRARLTFLVRGYPLANARDDAERDAKRALALAPSLGVAHQALGNVSALQANWLQAEVSYRAALAADPTNPDMHSGYAMVVLAPTGQLRHADLEGNKAYLLAPASVNHIGIVSLLSFFTGHDADALKFANLALALGAPANTGGLYQLDVLTAVRSSRYAEAEDHAITALSPAVRDAGGAEVMRRVFGALGDSSQIPDARQALLNLVHGLGVSHIDPGSRRDFIVDFAMLGALDPAYELANPYLDEFARSGSGGGAAWSFLWLPEMRPFRKDPRFQEFVTRLNFIAYWKQYGPPDECDLPGDKLTCH